ncbi:hypothetical protein [Endozoicomonas sp. ALD040]|uniref:hypothetical protein n=2 Tax=unclassified Endozoicomonas TaxID=2644528 RepID=UPI003BB224BC
MTKLFSGSMAILGKITVYVLFLNLFLSRNYWNKYTKFVVFLLFSSTLASASSGSLLENVEQVKKYEHYFKMLGDIAQSSRETSTTRNQYWRVHILRSRIDRTEYMLIDPELSSTPVGSPLLGSPKSPDAFELHSLSASNPFLGSSQHFISWRIDYQNHTLVNGPPFQRMGLSTFRQLSASGSPITFNLDDETLLSVRMRVQNHRTGDPRPKQRTFILVPYDATHTAAMLKPEHKPDQTFFCHYINSQNSTCEVCVEFETQEDEKSIHDLRTASHFYDPRSIFNNPVEQELSGAPYTSTLRDVDYQRFLQVFEQNIHAEFLNVEDEMSVDVSSAYKSIGHADARVIGRGQFSVVFTLDVLPGLALRRFPGYTNKRDADNFLLTHEAALKLYKELGVNLEPTRLLRIRAREGFTIYMIQRHLKKDELAQNFIEGLLDFGPDEIAMSIKSQGSIGEVHEMGYAEAVSRILHAVIAAIYKNLVKLGNEDCAHRICCDAKPDNFAVGFSYRKEWKRNNLYLRDVITQADLTDFHPCSLVLFDQLLFDGGPEAALLTYILGYNPYQGYQEKIKNWADAKQLIVKSLANIAYHAGDMAYEIMPELVDRTRVMLLDEWQSSPELSRRYMDYLRQGPVPQFDAGKLPLDRLFFDPDEITAESVIQYRNNSSRNNLKLKLHHYLLKLTREMRPEQFNHQLYLPVDYQQDWWLRIVDKKYRDDFSKALESRFSELEANQTNDSEPSKVASDFLRTLVNSVAADRTLVDEAKLSRLINWHIMVGRIPEHEQEQRKKHEGELKRIERDYLIRRVNHFYSSRLQSLHRNQWPGLPANKLFELQAVRANEIYEDSLKAFKKGFSKLQQLFWSHLVNRHQPPLSKGEQKQLDTIKKDEWIQQVNQKYSEKIQATLYRALGEQAFEDKIPLLANDSLLEVLIREILSDPRIPLFTDECASATEQERDYMVIDEPDNAPVKRSSSPVSQQSKRVELTQPSPASELLTTGNGAISLSRKGLAELMKKWGVYPMDVVQAEATTFPEAYSRLKSQSWAKALNNLNTSFPISAVYPLPETVRLRLRPRVYERHYLARELRLISSHDKVQFPSYTHRDTLIQAIKEVMEHRNQSREPKPLVIIDFSSSIDETISGATYHSAPPPSPPRIIVIQSSPSPHESEKLSQVKQVSIPLAQLNQWIVENRNYDYLLRILSVSDEDRWFTLKLPESVKSKRDRRKTLTDNQMLRDQLPPPLTSQSFHPFKRTKPENLPLTPHEYIELEQRGVTELSLAELTRLRARQAALQANLNQLEQEAVNALKSQRWQTVNVAPDHFCLYNSLVHLLNMRPETASKLIDHIIALLRKLVLTRPDGMNSQIIAGLFRNIIFLALKNNVISHHLLFQLRHLLFNDTPLLKNTLKGFLSHLPRHLREHLPASYQETLDTLDTMDSDELWSLLNQLITHSGNNTALDLLLADLINQLAVFAGQTQQIQLINDLVQHLSNQWHQDGSRLTPYILFLGLGAQALDDLMDNPTQAGLQMLQGLTPIQPGQHMWGDNNVVEHLLMPLLRAANTPLNVMIVTPAVHNFQNPLGAMFIPAMAGNPALGAMPVPSHDSSQIAEWLDDRGTITLFHGNLQAPLIADNFINAGNHWQPVVRTPQPKTLAPAVSLKTKDSSSEQQPVISLLDIKTEPESPPPLSALGSDYSDNDGIEIPEDYLPGDYGSLMATRAPSVLEGIYWVRWLVIIMTLVVHNVSDG